MASRVALITGCGKKIGIGSAAARALAASGVTTVVNSIAKSNDNKDQYAHMDQSWGGIKALTEEIVASGGTASWITGDVSSEVDAAAMVNEVLRRYGRLDILLNNAGASQGPDRADIEEVTLAAWENVMAVNARGVFLMSRAAVNPMRKQKWGRIINISSSAAKNGRKHLAVYSASKAAVVGFTRSLAIELAPQGITVNAVCPSSILTDRGLNSARKVGAEDIAAGLAERAKRIPVGRHGHPDDVAAMIVYLASEASGFVTGQALSVCGGIT